MYVHIHMRISISIHLHLHDGVEAVSDSEDGRVMYIYI